MRQTAEHHPIEVKAAALSLGGRPFGMVHPDIKPGNILCGANGTVFLTDFGIVRLMGRTRLTQHGTIGTGSTHRGERPP